MRLSDYRAVVFDLDDTLYLERDYVKSGFHAVACFLQQECAWPEYQAVSLREACLQLFAAGRRGDIFDVALRSIVGAFSRPSVDQLVRVYREHTPRIQLQRDAQALLNELRGHPDIWIITDGPLVSQQMKVRALGLQGQIRDVVFTDRWGRDFWKPHPRSFRHIQQSVGVPPRDCIYLADNPEKDFTAPRRLGWATQRIRRDKGLYAFHESRAGEEPDAELPSLWPLCQHPRLPVPHPIG